MKGGYFKLDIKEVGLYLETINSQIDFQGTIIPSKNIDGLEYTLDNSMEFRVSVAIHHQLTTKEYITVSKLEFTTTFFCFVFLLR